MVSLKHEVYCRFNTACYGSIFTHEFGEKRDRKIPLPKKIRMKRVKLLLIAFFLILAVTAMYFYSISYHQNIKRGPMLYCYETYYGPPNPALVIKDLEFKDSLIKYYDQSEKGINPFFNFPLTTLPQFEPVYLIKYSEDSLIALVASYYDRGRHRGGSYNEYYVDVRTLHKLPAPRKR
jgi:hypothetical protein